LPLALGICHRRSGKRLRRAPKFSLCRKNPDYIGDKREEFKVHTSEFVGHGTVIWLVCGINEQRGCLSVQAEDACRDVSSLVTQLETSRASGTRIKAES